MSIACGDVFSSLKPRVLTPGPWISTRLRHASNQVAQTSEAPSMTCRQHAEPRPLWSAENIFLHEPVSAAQKVGGRCSKASVVLSPFVGGKRNYPTISSEGPCNRYLVFQSKVECLILDRSAFLLPQLQGIEMWWFGGCFCCHCRPAASLEKLATSHVLAGLK